MRANQVCAVTIGVCLALLSVSVELCNGATPMSKSDTNGHILLYIPFAAKSSCITLVIMANELVKKGHRVTLVTAWGSLKPDDKVNHIALPSVFEAHNDRMSKAAFGTGANMSPSDMFHLVDMAVKTNAEAMEKLIHLVECKN